MAGFIQRIIKKEQPQYPTHAQHNILNQVLPSRDPYTPAMIPPIFEQAKKQLSIQGGSWNGLPNSSSPVSILKRGLRAAVSFSVNYRPPPSVEPIVGRSYSIGSDGVKLQLFTMVPLEVYSRLRDGRRFTFGPGQIINERFSRDLNIEPKSSLQILAIEPRSRSLWVRYSSKDGLWDQRFAPPGGISRISFSRFDRLVEAGRCERGRDEVLSELLSDQIDRIERVNIAGQFFEIGSVVLMPLRPTGLHSVRVLNSPQNRAIYYLDGYQMDKLSWSGSGSPPKAEVDSSMNRAKILRFSNDGTVALMRLEPAIEPSELIPGLQQGAIFALPVRSGACYGSARYLGSLFQDRYLKTWYIRSLRGAANMPPLDRCLLEDPTSEPEFGPAGE